MISIYCFTNVICIFMIIVKVSNSNGNYRMISTNIEPKSFTTPEYDVHLQYKTYWENEYHIIDQQPLDPKDFFLSLYNPYYYCVPLSSSNQDENSVRLNSRPKNAYTALKNMLFSLIASEHDTPYIGTNPKYWSKRPKFYELNKKTTAVYAVYKLMCHFNDEPTFFGDELIEKLKDSDLKKDTEPESNMLCYDDIIMLKEVENKTPIERSVEPKFHRPQPHEFQLLKKLMSFLPKKTETVEGYMWRHYRTVQHHLYLNKNVYNYIKQKSIENPFNKMSKDRVNNLKSPYLLKYEAYNNYVLRMVNMDIIPLHLDFFKNKYKTFKDWNQQTIFKDLEEF